MNPEELQAMQNEFGDAKASLSFSNMIREQQFMADNPPMEQGMEGEVMEDAPVEAPLEPEMAPEEEIAPEVVEEPVEEETEVVEEPEAEEGVTEEDLKGVEERLSKKIDDAMKSQSDNIAGIVKSIKDIATSE